MNRDHEHKSVEIDAYALRQDRADDPNLDELANNLRRGGYGDKLVILLGAGASVGAINTAGAKLPTALTLRNDLWRSFLLPSDVVDFDFSNLGAMSLDQAAAFAETAQGRNPVALYVAKCFRTKRTLWQHAVLPFLKPKSLYTTNYDQLLEHAWNVQSQDHNLSPLVPIFSAGQNVLPGDTPLYKPHGSADRALDPVGSGGPVITTVDYFEMMTDKETMLNKWLGGATNACILMIGYSMTDMDIAARLYDIKRNSGGLHWYSVFPRSDDTVRKYWSERLRIRPIDRRFAEFMADLDDRLNFIPEDWKFGKIATHRQKGVIL